jgi:hypothetical protein
MAIVRSAHHVASGKGWLRFVHSNRSGYRWTSSVFLLQGTPGRVLPDDAPMLHSYALAAFVKADVITY